MRHYTSEILVLAAASTLLLSSCAKELGGKGSADGAPLSFSAGTEEMLDVKGDPVTEETEFTAAGYNGSTNWFPATAVNTTDKYSSYLWIKGKSYTFYGYANMPESADTATAAIDSTGVTLTYTAVPATASAQKDILLGFYSGNGGGTGTADMAFYHPLSQVVFTIGDIEAISKISSISIKGVYGTGTTTLSTETTITDDIAQFEWTGTSGPVTVSQTVTGNLPEKDAQIGEPFMLIPQTFESPAKLKIQMTATTTAGEDQTITGEISDIDLEAGKKTVLAVSYSAQHGLNFTATVTGWSDGEILTAELEEALEYVEIPAEYDGKNVTYLKWYRQNLAISESGKKKWKGGNDSAVKVPGTNEDVIVGDFFQWAVYAGYCGDAGDPDKGLLIYESFNSFYCMDMVGHNIKLKSAEGDKKYQFSTTDSGGNVGISPYYSGSAYIKYTSSGENLERGDDVANIILGGDWRMPTSAEFKALKFATYWALDATDMGYYVFAPDASHHAAGFSSFVPADLNKDSALLFFPLSGCMNGISLSGSVGGYRSSKYGAGCAYGMYLTKERVDYQIILDRSNGDSVRPVSD